MLIYPDDDLDIGADWKSGLSSLDRRLHSHL